MKVSQLPDIFGTVPGWITSAGVVGILATVLKYQLGLKKISVEAQQVKVNARQVESSDDADIRDHYAEEVEALRRRLDEQAEKYRFALKESEDKHEQCQRDRERLRDDSRTLKDIVAGLIRIITQASASQAILLTPQASAEVRAAAERVQLLFAPVGPEQTAGGDSN